MKLGLIETTALASLLLLLGYRARAAIPLLHRLNIPAPVIGGLAMSIVVLAHRSFATTPIQFDTTLQRPLMIAFFTSIGFAASYRLLRVGGPQMLLFLLACSVLAILQNILGAGVATLFGLPPLFGTLTGAVTLAGGPATGMAFAPLFEQAGVAGAGSIALASGMGGIVLGSILGAPLATMLIERYKLRPGAATADTHALATTSEPDASPAQDATYTVLKNLTLVLLAMWVGSGISQLIENAGVTMPPYIGSLIIGAAIRNLDDATGWLHLSHKTIDTIGGVTLSLFLSMALMTLNLLELASLAAPLLINLLLQAALVAALCLGPVFILMGKDYDAAVMCGGFAGVMLGTTANGMAVMRSVVERYGIAPSAFLVVPIVGGFFLDFTNALIITVSVNLLS
ncbi:sodium/glutamate symporter [Steroidobacter sp.]|uniref:sodium/glutamate symporter n=1 Tax=Steroidobacter sp. TaxID=1978227 RepID=UPI001A5A0055|nr:sodium/glutamate symporter [Steroidobacter sp.]MBL8269108.1 sodium/glutamate symporter [Steroidobacter sp.]